MLLWNFKLQFWWLAIRPKTLLASISGVISGLALALFDIDDLKIIPAIATLMIAILLQMISNLANDVYDFEKGADTSERIGPTRVTQAGFLTPKEIKTVIIVMVLISIVIGLYLAVISSFYLLWLGAIAIICAIIYTGGPVPLGYYGLGDLLVFIFFGPVAVIGTYYIQTININFNIFAISIAIGLLTNAILIVNNLRDMETDRKTGKCTLAVRIGKTATRFHYSSWLIIAFLIVPILIVLGYLPAIFFVSTLAITLGIRPLYIVWYKSGKELNLALADTGKCSFIYSLLILVAVIINYI